MPQPERSPSPLDDTAFLAAYDRACQRFQVDPTPHNQSLLRTREQFLIRELQKPGKFELGSIVGTPGSLSLIEDAGHHPVEFLLRHKRGEWGLLDEEDRKTNEYALPWEALEREGRPMHGEIPWWVMSKRLFSRYETRTGEPLYVITEHDRSVHDRSVTTLLWPEEY